MSTSFFQYQFCSLCKISHKQRKKKHVHSQKHQITLKYVLTKFSKKVADMKKTMECPMVQRLGWEAGAKVWCYFCQTEVTRHQVREDCVIANAVILTHLARFVLKAEQAVSEFQKKEKEKMEQESARIRRAEQERWAVQWAGQQDQLMKTAGKKRISTDRKMKPAEDSNIAATVGKKTVYAFGPGLTSVTPAQEGEEEGGNIYTGATPPWLMEEEDGDDKTVIGPTLHIFNKHLENLKKQKLPAGRVGADFSHKADTSTQWLPAFGRVWNSGRRLNSRLQYFKEASRKKPAYGPRNKTASSTTAAGGRAAPVPSGALSSASPQVPSGNTVAPTDAHSRDGGFPGRDGGFLGRDGGFPGRAGGFPGKDGGFPGSHWETQGTAAMCSPSELDGKRCLSSDVGVSDRNGLEASGSQIVSSGSLPVGFQSTGSRRMDAQSHTLGPGSHPVGAGLHSRGSGLPSVGTRSPRMGSRSHPSAVESHTVGVDSYRMGARSHTVGAQSHREDAGLQLGAGSHIMGAGSHIMGAGSPAVEEERHHQWPPFFSSHEAFSDLHPAVNGGPAFSGTRASSTHPQSLISSNTAVSAPPSTALKRERERDWEFSPTPGVSTGRNSATPAALCRPYKRQKGVRAAAPVVSAGLIPITAKLLQQPSKQGDKS